MGDGEKFGEDVAWPRSRAICAFAARVPQRVVAVVIGWEVGRLVGGWWEVGSLSSSLPSASPPSLCSFAIALHSFVHATLAARGQRLSRRALDSP